MKQRTTHKAQNTIQIQSMTTKQTLTKTWRTQKTTLEKHSQETVKKTIIIKVPQLVKQNSLKKIQIETKRQSGTIQKAFSRTLAIFKAVCLASYNYQIL